MDWEKPEHVEISLACEVGSYANAVIEEAQGRGYFRRGLVHT